MQKFKFLQNNIKPTRRWISRYMDNMVGQLQWMYRPVGAIFYIEATDDGNGIITEEIKTMTVTVTNRYIPSYNQFMEMNWNKIIFAYEFVDNTDISNMIHYNEDNFDDMPRDRRLIFRGVIKDNETI